MPACGWTITLPLQTCLGHRANVTVRCPFWQLTLPSPPLPHCVGGTVVSPAALLWRTAFLKLSPHFQATPKCINVLSPSAVATYLALVIGLFIVILQSVLESVEGHSAKYNSITSWDLTFTNRGSNYWNQGRQQMSGKASGCWLDTVTPKLLPVVCSRHRSRLQPVVSPMEHTAQEDNSNISSEDATCASFSNGVWKQQHEAMRVLDWWISLLPPSFPHPEPPTQVGTVKYVSRPNPKVSSQT